MSFVRGCFAATPLYSRSVLSRPLLSLVDLRSYMALQFLPSTSHTCVDIQKKRHLCGVNPRRFMHRININRSLTNTALLGEGQAKTKPLKTRTNPIVRSKLVQPSTPCPAPQSPRAFVLRLAHRPPLTVRGSGLEPTKKLAIYSLIPTLAPSIGFWS